MRLALWIGCSLLLCISFVSIAEAYDGSTLLDNHTERRLKKYLERRTCPRTYRNTDGGRNEKIRCEYLLEEMRLAAESRLEARLRLRQRSIAERLYIIPNRVPVKAALQAYRVFNPDAPGSEPLESEDREIQVRRYASNDNCKEVTLNATELTRCHYLVSELDEVRRNALLRRRIATVAQRIANPQPHDFAIRRKLTTGYGGKSAGSEIMTRRSVTTPVVAEVFDPSGQGSVPLIASQESRLRRYVDDDKCPKNTTQEVAERCRYLLRLRIHHRSPSLDRAQKRLQSRGLYDISIRRGVYGAYRSTLGTTVEYIRASQKAQEYYIRPRTRKEIEEFYKTPVTVPGDCQVDKKLCNK
jgi:hypothetical protein